MKRAHVAQALGAVLIALSACTGGQGGSAEPVPTSGRSPGSATSAPGEQVGSSAIDPCALLDAKNDLAELGTFRVPERKQLGGARTCSWQRELENPADPGLVVSLDVRDAQGVDSVNDVGGGVEQAEVNGRQAAQAPSPGGGTCTIALTLGPGSRIDVGVVSNDAEKACEIAQDVAYTVEPRLPPEV
jgi:hypothetical protein